MSRSPAKNRTTSTTLATLDSDDLDDDDIEEISAQNNNLNNKSKNGLHLENIPLSPTSLHSTGALSFNSTAGDTVAGGNQNRKGLFQGLFQRTRKNRRRRQSADSSDDVEDGGMALAALSTTNATTATPSRSSARAGGGAASTAFHQAVRDSNIPQLRTLLSQLPSARARQARCNELDDTGIAPLHYAARHHNIELATLLIQYGGANTNIRDENGQTPLHFAARHKPQPTTAYMEQTQTQTSVSSFVALLCAAGADINARDYTYLSTPLHVAVSRGNDDVCNDLLNEKKISPDLGDKFQHTPLHLAAQAGHSLAIVRMLLARPDVSLRKLDINQCLALHLAAAKGNWEIVRLILEAMRTRCPDCGEICTILQQRDIHRNTPLMLAAQGGHKSVVRHLLLECDEGASAVDAADDAGDTALHFAAARGDAEICKWLVERGGNISAKNIQFQTPVHRAAALNRIQVVDYLLGTDDSQKEAIDQNSFTPLLLAARNGHAAMVKRLLEKFSVNVWAVSKRDRNVLHLAAQRNFTRVIENALQAGTVNGGEDDVRDLVMRRDRYGFYPLHSACQKGMLNAVKVLIEKGNAKVDVRLEDEKTPLHLAAQGGFSDVIDALTDVDYELVNYEDENAETALHMAAYNGHYDAVAKLIRCGANVLVRNSLLQTALDKAASRGHTKVCELLLKYDAPVHGTKTSAVHSDLSTGSTTPLHLACAGGYVETARLLVEQGHASLAARDDRGRNCLDLAVEHAQEDVAMYIVLSDDDQWREAMRNEMWQHNSVRKTPMRQLIRSMPKVAYAVLTRCLSTKRRPEDVYYKVTCRYEFMDDTFSRYTAGTSDDACNKRGCEPYTYNTRVLKDNHPLLIMVRHAREELLMHPLTYSLIHSKWTLYGRSVFLASFLLYCLYLALLTGYTLASSPVNRLFFVKKLEGGNETFEPFWQADVGCPPNTPWPLTADITRLRDADVCTAIAEFRNIPYNCSMQALEAHASGRHFMIFFNIGQYILLVSSIIFLFKSIAEWYVLRTIDCVIAGGVYIITIVMTIPWEGFNCFHEYGLKPAWKWQLASFNILLAYIHFVLLLRYLPWVGLYVQMLKDVTQTLLRVFLVFFGIMLAFALSFHCAFKASVRHDQHLARIDNSDGYDHSGGWELNPFYTLPQALVKTFTMLIGEYEQETHFLKTNLQVTVVVFTLLVLIGSVAVANLLVGLAVSDIKAVQDQATLQRVSMRINYVLSVERLMTWRFRRYMTPSKSVLYPNANDESLIKIEKQQQQQEGTNVEKIRPVSLVKKIMRYFVGASGNEDLGHRIAVALQRNAEASQKQNNVESANVRPSAPVVVADDAETVRKIVDEAVERIEKQQQEGGGDEQQAETNEETVSPAKQLGAMIALQTEILKKLGEVKKKLEDGE